MYTFTPHVGTRGPAPSNVGSPRKPQQHSITVTNEYNLRDRALIYYCTGLPWSNILGVPTFPLNTFLKFPQIAEH